MDNSVLRIFRSDFRLLSRLLTRFATYGSALLLADSILDQLRLNIFPNYYGLLIALLIAPAVSIVLAALLYAVIVAFPVKVSANGISCRDTFGQYTTVNWADISEVRYLKTFGLRYILVHIPKLSQPIAIPVFLEDLPDFVQLVESLVGSNHRLALALNKIT
jgi:hypothetical protein